MKSSKRCTAILLALLVTATTAFSATSATAAGTAKLEFQNTPVRTGKILSLVNEKGSTPATETTRVVTERVGTLTCPLGAWNISTKLVTNTSSAFSTVPGGNQYDANCTNASGGTVKWKNTELELESVSTGTGKMNLKFVWEWPGGALCPYVGKNLSFTYTPGTNQIRYENARLILQSGSCGNLTISGAFGVHPQEVYSYPIIIN